MRYPQLQFEHLARLSDSTGMLQHALWNMPDPRHGYTLDDNARAFVVALKGYRQNNQADLLEWARRYLAFMVYAQHDDGRFRNFAGYNRTWLEDVGSPDSNGRAVWALGYGVRYAPEAGMRNVCMWMFERAVPQFESLTSPRAIASLLLGCAEVYQVGRSTQLALTHINRCADSLAGLFDQVAQKDWAWFEQSLTYGNATLAQAMITAGVVTQSNRYLEIGRRSLEFLIDTLFDKNMLDLVGHAGWYSQGSKRAIFDQQPIDAGCMVEALLVAQQAYKEPRYGKLAHTALEWFYGHNRLKAPLYDEDSGGCRDGLAAQGTNENQGAESTLAHLAARLAIEQTDGSVRREPRATSFPQRERTLWH